MAVGMPFGGKQASPVMDIGMIIGSALLALFGFHGVPRTTLTATHRPGRPSKNGQQRLGSR